MRCILSRTERDSWKKGAFACVLILAFMAGCAEEGDEPITRADLYGRWKLGQQAIGAESYSQYVQIHTAVDINTNAVLWSDTIYFGSTTFVFEPCGDPCLIMGMELSSANVRPLNCSWELKEDESLLGIQSLVTPHMVEDTLINSHLYSFFDLVNGLTFTVVSATDNELELRDGNQTLYFIREN